MEQNHFLPEMEQNHLFWQDMEQNNFLPDMEQNNFLPDMEQNYFLTWDKIMMIIIPNHDGGKIHNDDIRSHSRNICPFSGLGRAANGTKYV